MCDKKRFFQELAEEVNDDVKRKRLLQTPGER